MNSNNTPRRFASRMSPVKMALYVLFYVVTIGIVASTFLLEPNESNQFPVLRAFIIVFAIVLLSKYFIYMMMSPWNEVRTTLAARRAGSHPTPRVSVLVPAWNEAVGIVTTLRTLAATTYPNTEVVIIDNASTDNTAEKVREFIAEHENSNREQSRVSFIYRFEARQGKGHALNTGIAAASGSIIISVDGDCSVRPDTVERFVRHFDDPAVMAAVGNVKIGNTKRIIGVVQYLEFLFSFYFKNADSLMNTIYIIGGAAGAFRKDVFERIGGYSATNITEDIDLSMRIQAAGMKIVYASDAVVFTEGATTLSGLMQQRLRWKRGRFETFLLHRRLFFSRDRKHSRPLSWGVLPLALFAETQMLFEPFFLAFLFLYSYLVNDFSSFISGIIIVSSMFFIQIFSDKERRSSVSFYFLAPIGWVLFYLTTFVEFTALIKSLWGYARRSEVKWQRWERQGVFEN